MSMAGIGGDAKFLKTEASFKQFIPFNYGDYIFSYGTKFGTISSLDNKKITSSNRFYFNSNSVRGFDTNGIGPRDSGNDNGYIADYTINSANTWEKKTITISGNTSNTISDDNGTGLNVIWVLCAGSGRHVSATSSWTSSGNALATSNQVNLWDNADNYFRMTGCQLEIGTTATEFEYRRFGDELSLFQRYYQRFVRISLQYL